MSAGLVSADHPCLSAAIFHTASASNDPTNALTRLGANHRARVSQPPIITWCTRTARLLPRLLAGRASGPVFTTDRRARVELLPGDIEAGSGRAWLSYRGAAELFSQHADGATLHRLRHSALTGAAEDGANTATLLASSGHISVTSLACYARVSPEGLAQWRAGRDLATRRR